MAHKQPVEVRKAPKEFRQLAKLSEKRLAEILGRRLFLVISKMYRLGLIPKKIFEKEAAFSRNTKAILDQVAVRAVITRKKPKQWLLHSIHQLSYGNGEYLPGLHFVTQRELPRSVKHLQSLDENRLAEIVAKRISAAKKLMPERFEGAQPVSRESILTTATKDAVLHGVPVKHELLGWFIHQSSPVSNTLGAGKEVTFSRAEWLRKEVSAFKKSNGIKARRRGK